VFADYADRREVQAALPATVLTLAPDADGGLWLDHVADLGDGFDPTYTVALLLAADALDVDPPTEGEGEGSPPLRLPRGRLLVLGGDQVYPTPSSTAYEDRLKGPYRAALGPGAVDPAPLMVALPGNHDWYDGLTAFLRLFAQRRPLGGWRTVQTRSYFAVQLPQRWWLVGVDTQLGTYIDDPQIRYFRDHLSALLQPGDGVIVAVPSPTWVRTGSSGDPDAFNALHYFEREVVEQYRDLETGTLRPTGARVRLWLTGDLHHYARYEERTPDGDPLPEGAARQFVTCGLGGSYLLDTHRLPDQLDLPSPESRMVDTAPPARYRLRSPWPPKDRSRRLVGGLLAGPPRGLPFRNPGFWRLAGGLQAALLLVLLFTLGLEQGRNLTGVLRHALVEDVLWFAVQLLVWAAVLWLLLWLRPAMSLHRPRPPSEAFWAVLAQVVLGLAGMLVLVIVPWPNALPDWVVLGLAVLATVTVTGLLASFVFAAYVALSRLPLVQGWQLSAQALEDWKGFVRLHIDRDGRLTLHPVVVDRVCHDWELDPPGDGDGPAGSVRPVPVGGLPRPHLVEAPVVIDRSPGGVPVPVPVVDVTEGEPAQPATTS
jgi:hypothetical protein